MHDQLISLIRTFIPALAGLLIAAAANVGIDIDNDALVSLLGSVIIGLYYAIARLLETRVSSAFGWLLGAPKAPTYDS